jgi:hypothetical protein
MGDCIDQYEFPTLRLLQEQSYKFNERTVIGYMHSKGVSKTKENSSPDQINHVDIWRENMMKSNIDNWSNILFSLSVSDVCGWHWVENIHFMANLFNVDIRNSKGYFEGNFWWSTSDFIKTLPDLNKINQFNRWEAEMWIGKSNQSDRKYFCLKSGKIYRYN